MAYWLSILFAVGVISAVLAGGNWAWVGGAVLFVLHPVIDFLLGRERPATTQHQTREVNSWDQILFLTPIFTTLALILGWHQYSSESSEFAKLGVVISVGLTTGFLGITTAHELVHRLNGWQRFIGYYLLWQVNFGHWAVEHVFGHHKNVGTKDDPATPRRNEWIYPYWLRSYFVGFFKALQFERGRLKRRKFWERILKNRVGGSWALQIAVSIGLWSWGGWTPLAFWWGQSAVAILLLKTVDYIEHYGLQREIRANGLPVPVQDIHSWDCDYRLTNWTVLNLGYHAQHHMKPLMKYQDLVSNFGRMRMPFGYSAMFLLALLPPAYFAIMNPRLR